MPLTLFKNAANELTSLEKEVIVPLIIDAVAHKHSKNTITSKNLSSYLKACGYNISDIRVRKIISYISGMNIKQGKECHLGDSVIIAAGNGYYVTDDPHVVDDQIESLIDRKSNLDFRIDSLRSQLLNLKRIKQVV